MVAPMVDRRTLGDLSGSNLRDRTETEKFLESLADLVERVLDRIPGSTDLVLRHFNTVQVTAARVDPYDVLCGIPFPKRQDVVTQKLPRSLPVDPGTAYLVDTNYDEAVLFVLVLLLKMEFAWLGAELKRLRADETATGPLPISRIRTLQTLQDGFARVLQDFNVNSDGEAKPSVGEIHVAVAPHNSGQTAVIVDADGTGSQPGAQVCFRDWALALNILDALPRRQTFVQVTVNMQELPN